MLLCQSAHAYQRGCAHKCFSNWLPGKLFSPVPLKQLDLQAEYSARLDEAIDQNGSDLAAKLSVAADVESIRRKLLSDTPSELFRVRSERLKARKHPGASTAAYNQLLREIYKPELRSEKVMEALSNLPGASQNKQALYIDPVHFERLVSESLADRQLCTLVVPMAEAAGLPTTARERAQLLLHLHASNQQWRKDFARFWPGFVASRDVGAWNLLLQLSYKTHCSDTWCKVNSHFPKPDRFTLMLRLKYDAGFRIHAARDVFAEFRKHGFVIDTVVITLFIEALLRSRRAENVTMAEVGRDHILQSHKSTRVIKRNTNQLARKLRALDAVNALTGQQHGVPLAADAELLEAFVKHYTSANRYDAAIDGIHTMARNGYYSRFLVSKLLAKNLDASMLEQLFYLCCDFETALPGFMSESLANQFVRAMVQHGESYECAAAIVSRNRMSGRVMTPSAEDRQLIDHALH